MVILAIPMTETRAVPDGSTLLPYELFLTSERE